MKTFLVVSQRNVEDHVGEEYDDYIEVEDQPTTETIQEWADRIRNRIRRLHVQDKKDLQGSETELPAVEIHLDAASPFNAMLINLQILMKGEEGIRILLPHVDGTERTTSDPEALEVIEKLDNR